MTPFWLPEIVAVVAAAFFVVSPDPRPAWKLLVIVAVGVAFALQHLVDSPVAWTVGLVLYVALGVSAIVYLKVVR